MDFDFGIRIKELRIGKKMSQAELAKKLGISNSMVSSYENGAKQPSVEVMAKIARLFVVSMDFMYGFISESRNNILSNDYSFNYIDASGLMESQRTLIVQLINEFKECNSIGTDNNEFTDNYDYYKKDTGK